MSLNYRYTLIYSLVFLFSQSSCDSQGHGGISNNINESKKRRVYVAEYEVDPNPYVINDTLKINVKVAWVEFQWAYGKSNDETIVKDKYQLVIIGEPDNLQNYSFTWRIGVNGHKYIRSCGSTCLVSDFDQLPKDEEEWDVQNGWELDSLSEKKIIGKFEIRKKGRR